MSLILHNFFGNSSQGTIVPDYIKNEGISNIGIKSLRIGNYSFLPLSWQKELKVEAQLCLHRKSLNDGIFLHSIDIVDGNTNEEIHE